MLHIVHLKSIMETNTYINIVLRVGARLTFILMYGFRTLFSLE